MKFGNTFPSISFMGNKGLFFVVLLGFVSSEPESDVFFDSLIHTTHQKHELFK